MQTHFTAAQLADADTASSEKILRKCVHCGFCTATCPTYVLLGDELDSPRGRIYLIKDMLEHGRPATPEVVQHVDRCLSCLACMTACPSGVHYQHLVDHARVHIERTYRRPWPQRALRWMLAGILPYPARFRRALRMASVARPLAAILPAPLRAMLELAPAEVPSAPVLERRIFPAAGAPRARVALMTGCAQAVLSPQVHEATIRVLNRAGAEVVTIGGCCGSLVHHLGRDAQNRSLAARLMRALVEERDRGGLDAVVANASGCGTHLKDYEHIFRDDAALAGQARAIGAMARDVTEVLAQLGLPKPQAPTGETIAYHSACSMQHGQKLDAVPRELLRQAGYVVKEIPEAHLCCGSAGTYNILQPEIARRLRERKLANIRRTGARVVAAGNIGCIVQLTPRNAAAMGEEASSGESFRVLHTMELLDRALAGAPE